MPFPVVPVIVSPQLRKVNGTMHLKFIFNPFYFEKLSLLSISSVTASPASHKVGNGKRPVAGCQPCQLVSNQSFCCHTKKRRPIHNPTVCISDRTSGQSDNGTGSFLPTNFCLFLSLSFHQRPHSFI